MDNAYDESERTARRIAYAVAAVVIALIVTVGGCQVNKQYVLRDMVKAGADPMSAGCAIYGDEGWDRGKCAVIASQPPKERRP